MACADCNDTGFKELKRGTVARCPCRSRKIAIDMKRFAETPTGSDEADIRTFVEVLQGRARGAKLAIKAPKLAEFVWGTDARGDCSRKLRAIAHAARLLGHPIGSGNDGYFYAIAPEELDEAIGKFRKQAAEQFIIVRKLRHLRAQLDRERNGAVYDAT